MKENRGGRQKKKLERSDKRRKQKEKETWRKDGGRRRVGEG